MLQFHHRHAPAAARLHAFDVDHENLAGPGKQREMCRQCVPFGVLRQHRPPASIDAQDQRAAIEGARSEEHTSELHSLMRISYAVFCLTKKTTYNNAK